MLQLANDPNTGRKYFVLNASLKEMFHAGWRPANLI